MGKSSPLLGSGQPWWPLADPSVGPGSTLASPRRIVGRNLTGDTPAWDSGRFGDGHPPSPWITVPPEHATSAPLRTCRLPKIGGCGCSNSKCRQLLLRQPLHSTRVNSAWATLWQLPPSSWPVPRNSRIVPPCPALREALLAGGLSSTPLGGSGLCRRPLPLSAASNLETRSCATAAFSSGCGARIPVNMSAPDDH